MEKSPYSSVQIFEYMGPSGLSNYWCSFCWNLKVSTYTVYHYNTYHLYRCIKKFHTSLQTSSRDIDTDRNRMSIHDIR